MAANGRPNRDELTPVAMPGDRDLDWDVDALVLDAVVVQDGQVLLKLDDGFGTLVDKTGRRRVVEPGQWRIRVGPLQILIVLADFDEPWLERYIAKLERWRDEAVPLRLCCAPGRCGLLLEDRTQWVMLPKRPGPQRRVLFHRDRP